MTGPMIEVEGITKRFGPVHALAGVDLAVEPGTVLALLGPNGAGKTTLVRILATLLRPDNGRARVAGYDVVADARALRSVIGLAGQYAAVDEMLTGRENLELAGLLYHLSRREYRRRAAGALERFGLTSAADRMVKTYSGGMRRRLDIAASLAGRPPVLFLDEPTTGLDPRTRNDLWGFIGDLVTGGTTVLLTTQYMEEAERLADRIAVLDAGRVIALGTAAELKDQVGGGVLEARVTSPADLLRAADLLADAVGGQPRIDADLRQVSVASRNGTADLLAAGRRLEEDDIALDDLGIRHPSLEDVFLALTGDAKPGRTEGPRRAPASPAAAAEQATAAGRAGSPPAPAPRTNPVTAAHDIAGIAKRTLLHMTRTPQAILFAVQPAMILVLFRYVLGGAIKIPGSSYIDYFVPAVFLEAMLLGTMATAIGLADDLRSGIIDRFRSLPMARSAVLAGRTIADLGRSVLALALMTGLAVAVGFRFHCTIPYALTAMALIIAFGYSFSWFNATIGLIAKDPETAQVAGVMPFFLLMFASSAVVPVSTMPGWLQPFARDQPFSVTASAVRALLQGQPAHQWIWQSLTWSAGILAAFLVIAVGLYRNITT
jgi:ABC-2 type transport system ATP-binding protein